MHLVQNFWIKLYENRTILWLIHLEKIQCFHQKILSNNMMNVTYLRMKNCWFWQKILTLKLTGYMVNPYTIFYFFLELFLKDFKNTKSLKKNRNCKRICLLKRKNYIKINVDAFTRIILLLIKLKLFIGGARKISFYT